MLHSATYLPSKLKKYTFTLFRIHFFSVTKTNHLYVQCTLIMKVTFIVSYCSPCSVMLKKKKIKKSAINAKWKTFLDGY